MLKLDHIVHYTDSPEQAAEVLKNLGLNPNPGGRHEQFGTYNILNYFADLSYIELIGSFDKALVKESSQDNYTLWHQFTEHSFKDNLERIALRHNNLKGLAESLKNHDLEVYGPFPYSRKTPDGQEIHWELLYANDPDSQMALPFFIDWKRPNVERKTDLLDSGAIKEVEKVAPVFESVGIVVKDASSVVRKWSEYFGLEIGEERKDEELNALGKSLQIGDKELVFYEPKGEGLAQKYLDKQGEGPFLIEITNFDEEKTIEINGALYKFTK